MAKVKSILDSPYFKALSVPLMIAIVALLWNITSDNKARNDRELLMKEDIEKFKVVTNKKFELHDQEIKSLTIDVTEIKVRHNYVHQAE